MKKYVWLSLVALLVVALLSFGVVAQEPTINCTPPPPPENCLTVYNADGTVATEAKAYTSGGDKGNCNQPSWSVSWLTHASVAQWVDFEFTGTAWYWYVRKPGEYYTDCNKLLISSNSDIKLTFAGFADLKYLGDNGVDETISTWYKIKQEATNDLKLSYALPETPWKAAIDLNQASYTINDSQALHDGVLYSLWNKIKVDNCNSACEYEDQGTIYISLVNQKPWIDSEGDFNMDYTI